MPAVIRRPVKACHRRPVPAIVPDQRTSHPRPAIRLCLHAVSGRASRAYASPSGLDGARWPVLGGLSGRGWWTAMVAAPWMCP